MAVQINLSDISLKNANRQWNGIKKAFGPCGLFDFEGELRGLDPSYVEVTVLSKATPESPPASPFRSFKITVKFRKEGTCDIVLRDHNLHDNVAVAKTWSDGFAFLLTFLSGHARLWSDYLATQTEEIRATIRAMTPESHIDQIATNIDLQPLLIT